MPALADGIAHRPYYASGAEHGAAVAGAARRKAKAKWLEIGASASPLVSRSIGVRAARAYYRRRV